MKDFLIKLISERINDMDVPINQWNNEARLRSFAPSTSAVAFLWSENWTNFDKWQPTGDSWNSEGRPFKVSRHDGLLGVAKPGEPRPDHRAAYEKLASDLAFDLGLPIPPVTLWQRDDETALTHQLSVSAWAFSGGRDLQSISHPRPPELQAALAIAASTIVPFDTWIGVSDRHEGNVQVENQNGIWSVAFIDYSFSFQHPSSIFGHPAQMPREYFSCPVQPTLAAQTMQTILALPRTRIEHLVKRIPTEFLPESEKASTIAALLLRRTSLAASLSGP